MIKERIKNLITEKTARIGVIGLGYVGLPLIVEFACKGFQGIGFEVDAKKAEAINSRRILHRRRARAKMSKNASTRAN